ncbi:pyridoxal kinase PdxY [Magnetospirillum molischianum]|uniref:pyridoxal kinase n=1 Tax=Magnetospirillum molischianum DSM 120 TaxID=1150626 RepID=H8FTG2_MAGML|nr:pyridoxal kinase PdxY [Magnetospirillum molischianum]CCG41650.1 Pyridoxamine kinase [Magnetospirillum molischianum DSM 120]
MKIVSLQSAVAYGYVGNSAALLPLQRLGHEVWPIDSVQFSNHPGYDGFRGMRLPAAHLIAMIEGLAAVGALESCDGLLTGYLGEADTVEAAVLAADLIRRANPDALYLCDPVMGDVPYGLYVDSDLPEAFRSRLLPLADIVTPNRFELEWLSRRPVTDQTDAVVAARALLAGPEQAGPRLTVVTSLEDGDDALIVLAVTTEHAWRIRTPRLPFSPEPSGTGDVLAALLFGHLLSGRAVPEALDLAVSGLFAVLERTRADRRRELALVAAQDVMIAPIRRFGAELILP